MDDAGGAAQAAPTIEADVVDDRFSEAVRAEASEGHPEPRGYDRMRQGMLYADVVELMGSRGVEVSRTATGGGTAVTYEWGSITATFINGRLSTKTHDPND